MYVKKHFFLPLTRPIRFNSSWALAFLTVCLHARACSIFLPSYLFLLSSFLYFLFMFEFFQEKLVHPSRLPGIFSQLLACWGALLEVGGGDPWILISFLGSVFPPGPFPMRLFQADTWRVQSLLSWSPELWSFFLPCFIPSWSWTPLSHGHCRQDCLHIPSDPFLFCECEQSISPHWFLCHLDQEVVTNALQDPPALFMTCCVVPQVGWSVPQVDQDSECEATSSFEQEIGLENFSCPTWIILWWAFHFSTYRMNIWSSVFLLQWRKI